MRVEHIGNATLYLGDCLEVLPTLPKVDAVITDPPYGVNLGSDPSHVIGNRPYEGFTDSPENVRDNVVPAIRLALSLAQRAIVTPGTRCAWLYDAPDELGAIYFPAGAGFSRWGFTCSQPILFYGKDPYMPRHKKPNSVHCTETAEKSGHPCPKPVGLMRWLVDRSSQVGDVVCDPFMGSGTTGVACMQLGRAFIGIEREPKYFDIACRRIEQAQKQGALFKHEEPKAEQLTL
jgi:site-specific DNA-methyltransferase (adenine-specific)